MCLKLTMSLNFQLHPKAWLKYLIVSTYQVLIWDSIFIWKIISYWIFFNWWLYNLQSQQVAAHKMLLNKSVRGDLWVEQRFVIYYFLSWLLRTQVSILCEMLAHIGSFPKQNHGKVHVMEVLEPSMTPSTPTFSCSHLYPKHQIHKIRRN